MREKLNLRPVSRIMGICIAVTLAFSMLGAFAPTGALASSAESAMDTAASSAASNAVETASDATAKATILPATAKKYTVTFTINMGKKGNACPLLTLDNGKKSYMAQAVSKWYIDGKLVSDPYSKFYSKGWKFSKHTVKVVMKIKVPNGTYKVYMDNGKTVKNIGSVTVKNKATSKSLKFA